MTFTIKTRQNKAGEDRFTVEIPAHVRKATLYRTRTFGSLGLAKNYSLIVEAAKLTGQKAPVHPREDGLTLDHLVSDYLDSFKFSALAPSSQKAYKNLLSFSLEQFVDDKTLGECLASDLSRVSAVTLIKNIAKAHSYHKSFHCAKVLRLVYYHGIDLDLLTANPFAKMRMSAPDDREIDWTSEELDTFIAACDAADRPNLGTMALMCRDMCQRPSDIRKMAWTDFKEGCFVFSQKKTGTSLTIPLTKRLAKRLERHVGGRTVVVNDLNGRPYTAYDYYKQCDEIIRSIGLRDELRMGDLRRTGTTMYADHGATEDQLAAMTGHKTRQTLSTYVKRSAAHAQAAIEKVQNEQLNP